MNREIKYRQPVLNGRAEFMYWHYWGLIDNEFVSPLKTLGGHTQHLSQQMSDFYDKNGTPVYEGDIIIAVDDPKTAGIVSYKNCSFLIEWQADVYSDLLGWSNYQRGTASLPEQFEVIGNIYTNPELLNP